MHHSAIMQSEFGDINMFNWNDIRVFLAVAEEGSTLAAANVIGINQTTVARRIEALEHVLKLELFERSNRGYKLTFSGIALLEEMKQMQNAAVNVLNSAQQLTRNDQGVIRFSGNAVAMHHFGVKLVSAFRELNPNVHFELQIDIAWSKNQPLLEIGNSDLALRPLDEISGDTLVTKRIAQIPLAVYCSEAYVLKYGKPGSLSEANGHNFLAYSDDIAQVMKAVRWLNEKLDKSKVLYYVNAVPSMAAALQSGDALGLLPCATGDATPDLVECFRHEKLKHKLWLVASKESYSRPAVKKFMAFAGQYLGSGR
ncbi:LysR family transcriptional regulator [Paraglaciecola arctica]|uniref:HTH lysR-type domain-containing protein n=1 Tax=Paraglaciecola arctica BSs20135 TaxID=493475 RepID=K6YL27_9ALTE|nr:LysR family transcriptional regulator [Paraglaciecola arctica]GAC18852.1 hypothetical protein GARC_1885 [Paraglaciecola arctica BSs20135]